MKSIKLLLIGMLMFFANAVNAQVVVNVNVGSPPQWGPVGYTEVRYYYLPDVEAYYDIESTSFIYYSGGVWIRRAHLPSHYRNYDLYGGYKVVITDYRGATPYVHFKNHKVKYKKGYKGGAQKTIGMKPGYKSPQNSPNKGSKNSNEKGKSSKGNHGHGGGKGKKK